MNIEFSSNAGMARSRLLAYLRDIKATDRRFRVVDLGGAAAPWPAEVADAFVDLHPSEHLPTITGDLHSPELWREIKSRNFDFCICSHTLEDLRDPIFVLSQIKDAFRHGYIAVPNKHVEFGHIESAHYVGYGHHRWIFTLVPGEHPIIPVMLGDAALAARMADRLLELGVYVIGFSFPVVPHGKARIRTQMSAAHTRAQLELAVDAFRTAGRELGVVR